MLSSRLTIKYSLWNATQTNYDCQFFSVNIEKNLTQTVRGLFLQ